MNRTLVKHGNSLALVIDKPILEMLQITADTPLEHHQRRWIADSPDSGRVSTGKTGSVAGVDQS